MFANSGVFLPNARPLTVDLAALWDILGRLDYIHGNGDSMATVLEGRDELAAKRHQRFLASRTLGRHERVYTRSEMEVLIFSSGIDDESVLKMLEALDGFAPQSA